MQDTELYNAPFGVRHPWRMREVKLDLAGDRVDVWVEEGCPSGMGVSGVWEQGTALRSRAGAGVAAPEHVPVPDVPTRSVGAG